MSWVKQRVWQMALQVIHRFRYSSGWEASQSRGLGVEQPVQLLQILQCPARLGHLGGLELDRDSGCRSQGGEECIRKGINGRE